MGGPRNLRVYDISCVRCVLPGRPAYLSPLGRPYLTHRCWVRRAVPFFGRDIRELASDFCGPCPNNVANETGSEAFFRGSLQRDLGRSHTWPMTGGGVPSFSWPAMLFTVLV